MFSNSNQLIMFSTFFNVLFAVASVVIGALITTGKVKTVKVLGIGYILAGILGFASSVISFLRYSVKKPELVVSLTQAGTYLSLIVTFITVLCICLFIHKNYGYAWIYFPVFAMPVIRGIASVISTKIFSIMGTMDYLFCVNLTNNITSLITGTVESVLLIIVFYKNRKKEKVIPHVWIIRLATFCLNMALPVTSIIFYAACLNSTMNGADLYHDWAYKFTLTQYYISIVNSLAGFALPIYILVMTKKAEKKLEETPVVIEENIG